MTEVSAWTAPVRSRDLTADELRGLDGLRGALAQVVDRTQPRAVSWLWDRTLAEHDGGPAPAGFVEAVAAAVGDLLAIHLPDVHWAVWPGPHGATLGVASGARPLAPVLPFLDAQDRWDAATRDWVHDYLARAAAHLVGAAVTPPDDATPVPQQHRAPDDDALPTRHRPVAAQPTPVELAPVVEPPADWSAPDGIPAYEPTLAYGRFDNGSAAAPAVPVTSTGPTGIVALPAEPEAAPAAPPVEPLAAPAEIVAPPAAALPAEPLEHFARDTLEHATSLLRDTGAFDGEVLVVLAGPDGRRTDSCRGETYEALTRARDLVRGSGSRRAAVVWVEREPVGLPGPSLRFPAVVVDAWDADAASVRMAHRFVDDVLGTDLIGELLTVGPAYPLR